MKSSEALNNVAFIIGIDLRNTVHLDSDTRVKGSLWNPVYQLYFSPELPVELIVTEEGSGLENLGA